MPDKLDDIFKGLDAGLEDELKDLKEDLENFLPMELTDFKQMVADSGKESELTEFDVLLHQLETDHAYRMNQILGNARDGDFAKMFMKLLDWKKPKLRATDPEIPIPKSASEINIQIIHHHSQIPKDGNVIDVTPDE